MRRCLLLIMSFILSGTIGFAQLTGTKTIPGTYATVAAAIADLNTQGVGSGGVTFNVTAGYTETFSSLTAGLITTTTSTSSNPIVFQKSGSGANPIITGFGTAPGTTDYIICLAGTDNITFNGIDVTEPTGVIEWGYAILKASATDGSQNVTIKNCNITLNKTNTATVGIYSNNVTVTLPTTQLTVTATTGSNSGNKFFSNTISNCYTGIYVYGYNDVVSPYLYYDQNNEIGKDGANTVSNFGGGTVANYGIFTSYQNGQKVANNIINGPCAGTGACAGIQLNTSNNSNVDLYNNTVNIVYTGTGTFYGIYDNRGNTFTSATVMNDYNNTVSNCSYATATSGTCYYMYFNGGASICNVYGNIVTNNTYGSSSTVSTGTIYGIYFNGCQNTTGIVSFYNNQYTNNSRIQSVLGSGTNYYLYLNGGGSQSDIYNNTVDNNIGASNGTTAGMYILNNPTGNKNIDGNTITNILSAYGAIYGIYTGNSYGTSIYKNKIQNLNANGATSSIYGINLSSLVSPGNMYCYNNFIGDLKTPATSTANAIYGIYGNATSVTNLGIYYNTVYINASSTGTNFGTMGLYLSANPTSIEVKNNIIVNTSVASGTGFTTAVRLSSTSLLNYAITSNNNDFYAGTPGPVNVIYYDGTNNDQTLVAFKSRVYPRESQSMTENPPFISVTPGTMNLHINPATPTQVESSGQTTSAISITTDFDGDKRYPTSGYPVNGTYPPIAPDLGADEFGGIPLDNVSPTILYTPLLNTSVLTARTLTATITDLHGVPTSGLGLPRIAWKKFYNGTWSYATGTSLGSNQYSFSFAGGVSLNDTIYYYVLAQDGWSTPNTGSYPIIGATGYTANPPTSATPPTTPFKYAIIQGICGTFNVGAGQIYPTLTAAIADLNTKDLTCPVTYVLTDNSYGSETYPIIINQIAGASATNTITIKPAPGITPVFATSYLGVTPNYWSMITLNGTQWLIIDGSNSGGSDRSMTFANIISGGFAAAIGLYNNGTIGASNIVIKNCVIQAHTEATYNAQGIVLFSISGNGGYNNVIINNNTINAAKFGVQIAGIPTNKATNCQVTNNTIGSLNSSYAVIQYGVELTYADNTLVQGNEIIGPASGNAIGGFGAGVFLNSGATNSAIRRNLIHDIWQTASAFPASGAYGIMYGGEATSLTEFSNNSIYNIKAPGQSTSVTGANPWGIFINSGGNIQIYSNTVFMNGAYLSATTAGMSGCLGFYNGITNVDVKNNIFKNSSQPASGTPSSKSYAVTVGSTPTNLTFNYNDYFVDGVGPVIGYINGSDQATLANWQSSSLQDANSLNIDPVFTTPSNLIPTTALMPHAGVYISTVPTDILGTNRTNPPDIGAYEFTIDPIINTTAATFITNSAATLNGSANAKSTTFNLFFDWGLTNAYGSSIAASPATVTGTTLNPMNQNITGLSGYTTYHYRARGVTTGGLTVYGNDMTFITAPNPPTVVTTAASAITSSGATLNGTVNANGGTATITFDYGLTPAYGTTINGTPASVSGLAVNPVSGIISGLLPNTTYHYRVNGANISGTTNGNDMTFTTLAILPIVVTNFASGVGSTTATLNGTVTANNAVTTVTFQYGLTVAYGNTISASPSTVNGMTASAVGANLAGLSINTTYHFRCVGVNVAGIVNGLDQTFITNCVAPVITISGPSSACSSTTGYVYSTDAGMTGYTWNISSGGVITSGAGTNSITVTWNTTGAQTVSVNYNNQFGCSASSPLVYNVTVNASPVPTINGSTLACLSSTNNTYSTQTGMSGYIWTVSAGGIITAGQSTNTITVTWNTTGAKTVTVNYSNASGCFAPSPTVLNVTVNTLPSPTISGSTSICVNSGYITYTTESGMTAYNWTVSTGGVINFGSGTNQISVSWISSGAQTVSVNYNNANGCSALNPTVLNVTVNALPNAAGTITGTSTVCGGAQGIAYSCPAITGALSYVWTLQAGATIATGSGTNSITVNFDANAASGNITVYGNNLCGNGTPSPNFALTVNALPASAGTITGPSEVCQSSSGVEYSVPAITNATGYSWTVPAGAAITTGANTNAITVDFNSTASSGNITVLGTNSCGNGVVSPDFMVNVNAIPTAPVVTNTGYTLESNAPSGNQWYFEGNLLSGATGQTYLATQTGYYWDVVTLNTCSSDTSNHKLVVVTGIDTHSSDAINIYPVPNDGTFTISITSKTNEPFSIIIYSNLGDEVYVMNDIYVNGHKDQAIDLKNAANGIYSVVIRNNNYQTIKKVVVSR